MENTALKVWDWDSAWPAPAKLNLFLHVVGRRNDGYHLLQTVFRFIDRCDMLRFEARHDDRVVLATPIPGVPEENDLTVRAAKILQQATFCRQGVNIHLEKILPMGGGLGGGSSDAATTLIALNHLWQAGLDRTQLQGLGLALGADVPVFVHGRNTFAEGVGERFSEVELPPSCYLVIHPGVSVPTGEIFSASELKRDTPRMQVREWSPGMGRNDLEPVACRRYPEVARQLAWLREHAPGAMMTGSGACLFAGFPDRVSASATLGLCPESMKAWIAEGLPEHPLSAAKLATKTPIHHK